MHDLAGLARLMELCEQTFKRNSVGSVAFEMQPRSEVVAVLRNMGFLVQENGALPDCGHDVDILLGSPCDEKVVVEVDGPSRFVPKRSPGKGRRQKPALEGGVRLKQQQMVII